MYVWCASELGSLGRESVRPGKGWGCKAAAAAATTKLNGVTIRNSSAVSCWLHLFFWFNVVFFSHFLSICFSSCSLFGVRVCVSVCVSASFWFIPLCEIALALCSWHIWAVHASYYDSIIHPDKNGDDDTLSPFRYAHAHFPSPIARCHSLYTSSMFIRVLAIHAIVVVVVIDIVPVSFSFPIHGCTVKNVGHISWLEWANAKCQTKRTKNEKRKESNKIKYSLVYLWGSTHSQLALILRARAFCVRSGERIRSVCVCVWERVLGEWEDYSMVRDILTTIRTKHGRSLRSLGWTIHICTLIFWYSVYLLFRRR